MRRRKDDDRRHEDLSLTKAGQAAFDALTVEARAFDDRLMSAFTDEERAVLRRCLLMLAGL